MGALVLTDAPVKLDGDDTLDTIAGKIKACLKRSEDYRVTAGQLLAEARHRVDAGEAGAGMGWEAWCKANVERSYRDVQRLLAIAAAPEPAVAAETERARRRVDQRDDTVSPPRVQPRRGVPKPSLVDDYPEPPRKATTAWVHMFLTWPTHIRKTAVSAICELYERGEPASEIASSDGDVYPVRRPKPADPNLDSPAFVAAVEAIRLLKPRERTALLMPPYMNAVPAAQLNDVYAVTAKERAELTVAAKERAELKAKIAELEAAASGRS